LPLAQPQYLAARPVYKHSADERVARIQR
jgi:hypothetical protein